MATDILKPLRLGKEIFHPQSFDEKSFIMKWTMKGKGMVPPHIHRFADEHFAITRGEVNFRVNGKTILKKEGEELLVPKGTPHSIRNRTDKEIEIIVTYSPCADTHRMFEIMTILDESNSGSMKTLMKYFYLSPRLGLKPFSTPHPAIASKTINLIATVIGKCSGWDKHLRSFR